MTGYTVRLAGLWLQKLKGLQAAFPDDRHNPIGWRGFNTDGGPKCEKLRIPNIWYNSQNVKHVYWFFKSTLNSGTYFCLRSQLSNIANCNMLILLLLLLKDLQYAKLQKGSVITYTSSKWCDFLPLNASHIKMCLYSIHAWFCGYMKFLLCVWHVCIHCDKPTTRIQYHTPHI